jgi:hypothetical protein
VISSIRIVGHLVDRDGDREDESIVLARGGLDAVCVAQREPALRYAGYRVFSAAELVLVVQDVPLSDDVLASLHVDREFVAKRRKKCLADRGDGCARAQDLHALAQGELLLMDRRYLAALQILEHEGVAQAHDLPVYPEDRVAVLVRDVEILAERDEPLPHGVTRHVLVRPLIPLRRQARTAARTMAVPPAVIPERTIHETHRHPHNPTHEVCGARVHGRYCSPPIAADKLVQSNRAIHLVDFQEYFY